MFGRSENENWLRYDEDHGGWQQDHSIPLTRDFPVVTPFIAVQAPEAAGIYEVVTGELPNGFPLWKRPDGDDWIFSSPFGQWAIHDEEQS